MPATLSEAFMPCDWLDRGIDHPSLNRYGSSAAPVVAAAADLQFAVEEIAAAFNARPAWKSDYGPAVRAVPPADPRGGPVCRMFVAAPQFIFDLHRDSGFTRDRATSTLSGAW